MKVKYIYLTTDIPDAIGEMPEEEIPEQGVILVTKDEPISWLVQSVEIRHDDRGNKLAEVAFIPVK